MGAAKDFMVEGIEDMMHAQLVNIVNELTPYVADKERHKREIWDNSANLARTLATLNKHAGMRERLATDLPSATDAQAVAAFNQLASPAPGPAAEAET